MMKKKMNKALLTWIHGTLVRTYGDAGLGNDSRFLYFMKRVFG
jgi:hypothetical protein